MPTPDAQGEHSKQDGAQGDLESPGVEGHRTNTQTSDHVSNSEVTRLIAISAPTASRDIESSGPTIRTASQPWRSQSTAVAAVTARPSTTASTRSPRLVGAKNWLMFPVRLMGCSQVVAICPVDSRHASCESDVINR